MDDGLEYRSCSRCDTTLLLRLENRTDSGVLRASSNDIRNLGYLLTHYLKVDEISMSS